jgi:hypothetical protein
VYFLDSVSLFTNKVHNLSKNGVRNHKIATPTCFSTLLSPSGGDMAQYTLWNGAGMVKHVGVAIVWMYSYSKVHFVGKQTFIIHWSYRHLCQGTLALPCIAKRDFRLSRRWMLWLWSSEIWRRVIWQLCAETRGVTLQLIPSSLISKLFHTLVLRPHFAC